MENLESTAIPRGYCEKQHLPTKSPWTTTNNSKATRTGKELPINGETNIQFRERELRNQEKRVQGENQCQLLDNLEPKVDGVH